MKYFGNLYGIEWDNKEAGFSMFSEYLTNFSSNGQTFYADTSEIVFCDNEKCSDLVSTLVMMDTKECGVLIQYESRSEDLSKERRKPKQWYSKGELALSNDFCELGDNIFFPKGCCLKPMTALKVIEEFFLHPKILPTCINWVNPEETHKLDWPEE